VKTSRNPLFSIISLSIDRIEIGRRDRQTSSARRPSEGLKDWRLGATRLADRHLLCGPQIKSAVSVVRVAQSEVLQ